MSISRRSWAPRRRGTPLVLALSVALTLAACGGGGGGTGEAPAPAEPSPASVLEADGGHVHVNQAGYAPYATKYATVAGASGDGRTFVLLDEAGGVAFEGSTTLVNQLDPQSGDYTSRADFTSCTRPGTYVLRVIVDPRTGVYWESVPFAIRPFPYGGDAGTLGWYFTALLEPGVDTPYRIPLATAAMKYFFYNRTGVSDSGERHRLIDIVPGSTWNGGQQFLNADLHARVRSRANGDLTPAFLNWTDAKFKASKYHWDAGDDAFYPVNTAFFDGLLMEMYEHYQSDLAAYGLNIPESLNRGTTGGVDLLSEVAYDAEAMKTMLPPSTAKLNIYYGKNRTPIRLASHKIGMWDGSPWVGDYNPNLDAYCNFVPLGCSNGSDGSTCTAACKQNGTAGVDDCLRPAHPAQKATGSGLPDSCWTTGASCLFPAGQGWYASHPPPALPTETADSRSWAYGSIAARGTYDCGSPPSPIYASKPSTAATFAVARYLAQLARLIRPYSSVRAADYWAVAKDAYNQAVTLPTVYWRNNGVDRRNADVKEYTADNLMPYVNSAKPASASVHKDYDADGKVDANDYTTPRGSGPYEDDDLADDQYAAAVQMYLTALARSDRSLNTYRSDVLTITQSYAVPGSTTPAIRSLFQSGWVGAFDWKSPATVAQLSLLDAYLDGRLQADPDPKKAIYNGSGLIKDNLQRYAAFLIGQIAKQPYPSAIPVDSSYNYGWYDSSGSDNSMLVQSRALVTDGRPEYPWGSNKHQVYGGIVILRAAELLPNPGEAKYLNGYAGRIMDYLMGNNPLGRSYITGYGVAAPRYVHHRAALYGATALHTDPPIGWLVGGPMSEAGSCGYTTGYDAELGTPRFSKQKPWNRATALNDGKTNAYDGAAPGVTAPFKMRAIAPDTEDGAAKGWCSLEVAGDWNAGLAYFAYALQRNTACSLAGEYCNR